MKKMRKLQDWLTIHWQIISILVVAFLLRLPLLNSSFWLDEAAQALESSRPLSQQLNIVDDFQPPFIHVLIHFLLSVSRDEAWLRFGAALIPAIITIWGVYCIGKRWSQSTGLIAAVFLATSSFHIFYSQELRPYALPAMFAVLSWWVILHWGDRKGKIPAKEVTAYVMLTLGGLFSSYLYPFLFFAQLVYVLFLQRKHWRAFMVSCIFVGAVFGVWLPTFFAQLHAGQLLRTSLPGWEKVVGFSQLKSLLLIYGKFVFGILDLDVNIQFLLVSGIFSLIVFAMVVTAISRKKQSKNFWLMMKCVLCWFVAPILTAWIVSFFIPVLQPKRVLFCLPALYLGLAVCIVQPQKGKYQKFLPVLLTFFVVCINLFSCFSYWTQPKYQREDWRGAYAQITSAYPAARSTVAFAFPEAFAPWSWYDTQQYPTFVTGQLSTSALTPADFEHFKNLNKYQYILVFDYLRDLTDPQNVLVQQINNFGYHEVDEITPKTPLGFVRVFAKESTTISQVQ
jgi:uncharacterized membrane protein